MDTFCRKFEKKDDQVMSRTLSFLWKKNIMTFLFFQIKDFNLCVLDNTKKHSLDLKNTHHILFNTCVLFYTFVHQVA